MSEPRQPVIRVARVVDLPSGYAKLRDESVAEGYGHLRRLETDWDEAANRFGEPGEALWAALVTVELVGVGGINRDPYSSDQDTGRIRRLYVSRSRRYSGVGRRLVSQALALASDHFAVVCVRAPDAAAAAFYEALGFSRAPSDSATHRLEAPFV